MGNRRTVSPSLEQRLTRDTSFERLYRRHRRDVYGAVLRDVRDPDEAEDVTQIAFMNAFRAIRRGEEPDKPRAWLVAIARNVVRRRFQAPAGDPGTFLRGDRGGAGAVPGGRRDTHLPCSPQPEPGAPTRRPRPDDSAHARAPGPPGPPAARSGEALARLLGQ